MKIPIILIIFLPLLSFLSISTQGLHIGKNGAKIVSTSCLFVTLYYSIVLFFHITVMDLVWYINFGTWINCGLFEISWGFMFDGLSCSMLVIVNSISCLVHLYSCGYMHDDPHLPRFMSYLSLFTFFMIILVSADNFIVMFLGWEGVGLCSFLLISFWFTRLQANKAAIKAIVVNRVGDFCMVAAIAICLIVFKSTDYTVVFSLIPFFIKKKIIIFTFKVKIIDILCVFLLIAAAGKSAQLGLHTWLPDAMEGPTPVSALIHAATMVTAGVFLMVRCSPLFEYSPSILTVIFCLGSVTSFFSATLGLFQNDLKKVIAYSTCSQLGYMVSACGLSGYNISLFHLFNHAFFKALLFLSAGAIIHSLADEQDMKKTGGLIIPMYFSYTVMIIGSLALAGFPFLSGFYSKDIILELAYSKYSASAKFSYWFSTISAFLTSFYSFRLIYLLYLAKTNSFKYQVQTFHNLDYTNFIPMFLLSLSSIFSGYLFKDYFMGLGGGSFSNPIFLLDSITVLNAEFLPLHIKHIPTVFSLFGIFSSIYLNTFYGRLLSKIKVNYPQFHNFFASKWHFDKIYTELVVKKKLTFGYNVTFKDIDKGILEFLGPLGLSYFFFYLSVNIRLLFVDNLYNYISLSVLCLSLLNVTLNYI